MILITVFILHLTSCISHEIFNNQIQFHRRHRINLSGHSLPEKTSRDSGGALFNQVFFFGIW